MAELKRTERPFQFFTRLHLTELTGLRATNLLQLVSFIRDVPGSCIYHHTHRFLQQHQYLSPEPPNDFAYWVTEVLGEDELGERLSSIDTIQYTNIRQLRNEFIKVIEEYLKDYPSAKEKFARGGDMFNFMKSVSFVVPTNHTASDLKEFIDVLNKITIDSIYYHVFEARLRLEKGTNDFSYWIESAIGDKHLADEVARLDPYTFTMEELRKTIIDIIEKRIV